MTISALDVGIFACFYAAVLGFSLHKSRRPSGSSGYFLGGRSLPWWLIGVSVVAANLSTEQFVGMAGQAAGEVGLAVSAWQLTGIVGIVLGAFWFLPGFLRAGIYTMPEYLEYRYNALARGIMSVMTVVIYVTVTTSAVLYSGATTLETVFGVSLGAGVFLIAILALVYVVWGGLLAAVWADLFQGTALLVGGLVTAWLGWRACGGWGELVAQNPERLHLLLPRDHAELPWTALLGGIWIPIFYYCSLNQFIMQRTLAARSLREGQLGVIFAGALWLLVPVGVVLPGIMARQLFGAEMAKADDAYPLLVRHLVPEGLRGFIFAALAGAVISTLASVLNSASTIFTMDIYQRLLRRDAGEVELVRMGRGSTVVFMVLACGVAMAPVLKGGVFTFIQEFQGYVSPGILATFSVGFVLRKAPPAAGVAALVLSAPLYGFWQWVAGGVPYLHRMLWTYLILVLVMAVITAGWPLKEARRLPVQPGFGEQRTSPWVYACGTAVIVAVLLIFAIFH